MNSIDRFFNKTIRAPPMIKQHQKSYLYRSDSQIISAKTIKNVCPTLYLSRSFIKQNKLSIKSRSSVSVILNSNSESITQYAQNISHSKIEGRKAKDELIVSQVNNTKCPPLKVNKKDFLIKNSAKNCQFINEFEVINYCSKQFIDQKYKSEIKKMRHKKHFVEFSMQTPFTESERFVNHKKKNVIIPATIHLHQVDIKSNINRDISFDLLNYMNHLQNKSKNK